MAVVALRSIVYKRLVAIVEAAPAVYNNADKDKVRSGTLLRMDGASRGSADKPVNRQFGDLPELVLNYEDADFDDATGREGYGHGRGSERPGIQCEFVQQFRLTLTHAYPRSEKNDTLSVALLEALATAGPSMGLAPAVLPFVLRGRISMRNAYGRVTRPLSGEPETTDRQQTTYAFPVTVRWNATAFPTQTT